MSDLIKQIGEFSCQEGDWSDYADRIEQSFVLQDVPVEKQVALLITVMGHGAYKTLRGLCHPDHPKDLSFRRLSHLMREHFDGDGDRTYKETARATASSWDRASGSKVSANDRRINSQGVSGKINPALSSVNNGLEKDPVELIRERQRDWMEKRENEDRERRLQRQEREDRVNRERKRDREDRLLAEERDRKRMSDEKEEKWARERKRDQEEKEERERRRLRNDREEQDEMFRRKMKEEARDREDRERERLRETRDRELDRRGQEMDFQYQMRAMRNDFNNTMDNVVREEKRNRNQGSQGGSDNSGGDGASILGNIAGGVLNAFLGSRGLGSPDMLALPPPGPR